MRAHTKIFSFSFIWMVNQKNGKTVDRSLFCACVRDRCHTKVKMGKCKWNRTMWKTCVHIDTQLYIHLVWIQVCALTHLHQRILHPHFLRFLLPCVEAIRIFLNEPWKFDFVSHFRTVGLSVKSVQFIVHTSQSFDQYQHIHKGLNFEKKNRMESKWKLSKRNESNHYRHKVHISFQFQI